MKINFTNAVLTDLDGEPILNDAGEQANADYKYLAKKIYESSIDEFPMPFLDKLEIAQKINKGEDIDLERPAQEAIKGFMNIMSSTRGHAVNAWLNCFEKEEKPKSKSKEKS